LLVKLVKKKSAECVTLSLSAKKQSPCIMSTFLTTTTLN
jgi:hypothetical protein